MVLGHLGSKKGSLFCSVIQRPKLMVSQVFSESCPPCQLEGERVKEGHRDIFLDLMQRRPIAFPLAGVCRVLNLTETAETKDRKCSLVEKCILREYVVWVVSSLCCCLPHGGAILSQVHPSLKGRDPMTLKCSPPTQNAEFLCPSLGSMVTQGLVAHTVCSPTCSYFLVFFLLFFSNQILQWSEIILWRIPSPSNILRMD